MKKLPFFWSEVAVFRKIDHFWHKVTVFRSKVTVSAKVTVSGISESYRFSSYGRKLPFLNVTFRDKVTVYLV